MTKKKHLRDLPFKAIYIRGLFGFPQLIEAYIAESVYDQATGQLDVHGLVDVTETEEGKFYLSQPAGVGDGSMDIPPIHRVYLDSESTWILLQHGGFWTLVFVPRREVTHPPPMPAQVAPRPFHAGDRAIVGESAERVCWFGTVAEVCPYSRQVVFAPDRIVGITVDGTAFSFSYEGRGFPERLVLPEMSLSPLATEPPGGGSANLAPPEPGD